MYKNGKIKEIEELARIVGPLRREKKKIIQCHGVFDLLHIGHIRHLRQAKQMGDVLIVTVTPDHFVNKGPHRPAFNQELRAEALAALDDVDYVAVNKWPMAVEAIQLLQPDVYVKGLEYQKSKEDHTGGIVLEEEAVKSVGGRIAFTDDITFSASSLINRGLQVFPKETSDYLARFSERYSSKEIIGWLEKARSLRVLVVGETVIDEYQYCTAIGKSSKEPMLAVKRHHTEKFAGGILAAANHLSSFASEVGVVTFLGNQNSEEEFIRGKLNEKIRPTFLYRKDAPTIVKQRFIESYFFTKMMEVYEMNDAPLPESENRELCETLSREIPRHDLVLVIDFGHGMLSREAIEILCSKSSFLALNAQSNAGNVGYHTVSKYPRADYVGMTNAEIRLEMRDRESPLSALILELSKRLKCPQLAVTRGKDGCACLREGEGYFEVPAFAGQVLDRMGAGDAFISITALTAAQGAPIEVTGFIGNAVGAQAVATVGHQRYIERIPLYKQIEALLK